MNIKMILFIIGLLTVNFYIYWLSQKIVPFSASLDLCSEKKYQFTVKRFYPGTHSVGIYFKDGQMSADSKEIRLSFRCTISSGTSVVYDKMFDIHKMDRSGWGVKYIPNVDVGYFRFPVSSEDESPFFYPKYFSNYIITIEIIDVSKNFCKLNPTIAFFCSDIDQGYFGGEYILYNILYFLLSIILLAGGYFIKKISQG